jgi:zinc transporter ZupT
VFQITFKLDFPVERMTATPSDVAAYTLSLSLATSIGSLPFFFLRRLSSSLMIGASAVCAGFTLSAGFGILHDALSRESESPSLASALFSSFQLEYRPWAHLLDVVFGVWFGVWVLGASETVLSWFGVHAHEPIANPPPLPIKSNRFRGRSRSRSKTRSRNESQTSPSKTNEVHLSNATDQSKLHRARTFLFSITLHAMAEGVGTGIAFATGDVQSGLIYVFAMACHNVPEGAVVTAYLLSAGLSPFQALLANILHCLPQVLVSVPAFLLADWALCTQHIAAGVAAGTLLHTTFVDLLPEVWSPDSALTAQRAASLVIAAAVVMLCVDAVFRH